MKGFFEDLQKFSLPRVAFLETFFEKTEKLDIADKAPRGFIDKAWRNFADEALDEKIRTEPLQHIHEEIQIFFQTEPLEVLRTFGILLFHSGSLDDLELMEFHRTDRKGIYQSTRIKHHLSGFSRKTEDEMHSDIQPALGRHLHCQLSCRKIMTTIDPFQSDVIAGLDTVLHYYNRGSPLLTVRQRATPALQDIAPCQFSQIIQFPLVHAIRSGTDHDTYDIRMSQSLLIKRFQTFQRSIRIRKRLKISKIVLCSTIADLVEFNTFVQLLMQALAGSAVRRVEGSIVTICASSPTDLTVAVRTSKAGIQNYLLKPLAIFPFEIPHKGIISFSVRESVFFVTHNYLFTGQR